MLPPPPPPLPHNIILFELVLNVKFPLLRLLQFLSDLKSTNLDSGAVSDFCSEGLEVASEASRRLLVQLTHTTRIFNLKL